MTWITVIAHPPCRLTRAAMTSDIVRSDWLCQASYSRMARLKEGVPMSSNTRAKMVAGAADLMSRRGVNATSMRDVVRHTGTPRGSIGHHFPRGKQQLIEDALVFAGSQVSGPLKSLTEQHGAISGLRAFIALWRQTLERSKFQAGCPVLAVAVEQYVNDATEKDGMPDQAAQKRLLDLAEGVFADWQDIMITA